MLSRSSIAIISGTLIGVPWMVDYAGPIGTIGWAMLVSRTHRSQWNDRSPRSQRAEIIGSFFTAWAIAFTIAYHWVPTSLAETTHFGVMGSWLAFLCLMVWESLPFAMLGGLLFEFRRRWNVSLWVFIPIWVSLEVFWPKIFSSSIAHAYLDYLPWMQVAELGGTPAVAIVVLMIHFSAARTLEWVRLPINAVDSFGDLVAMSAVLIGVFVWGSVCVKYEDSAVDEPAIQVALIQTDPSVVMSSQKLIELSDSVPRPVDLVVWPESAIGVYDERLKDFRDDLTTIELSEAPNPAPDPYPSLDCFLLAGGKSYTEGGRGIGPYRNNAYLIDSNKQIAGWTTKRILMPLGEYVPLEHWMPWTREITAIDTELIRGTDYRPLSIDSRLRIGALICYEDMDCSVAAAMARSGANVLVAIVNAEAFKNAATRRQHLRLAQLRAIENRKWFLRCSSTGVTCEISPSGRITQKLPIDVDGFLTAQVYPREQTTVFSIIQPYLRYGLVGLVAVSVVIAHVQHKKLLNRTRHLSNKAFR